MCVSLGLNIDRDYYFLMPHRVTWRSCRTIVKIEQIVPAGHVARERSAEDRDYPSWQAVGLTPDSGHTRVSEVNVDEGVPNVPESTLRYKPEFRAVAVRLVRSATDKPVSQIARELGVSDNAQRS